MEARQTEKISLLMVEFLTWIARQPRTYADVMAAWRSTCPRHCVWEDALADGLVQLERGVRLDQARVRLTAQSRAILEERRQ
jgi:hypothetical protein